MLPDTFLRLEVIDIEQGTGRGRRQVFLPPRALDLRKPIDLMRDAVVAFQLPTHLGGAL